MMIRDGVRLQGTPSGRPGGSPVGIATIGDDGLRATARPVEQFDEGTAAVIQTLSEKLGVLRGAGLAAPQIGVELAVAVVQVHRTELFPDRPETPLFSLVNPLIVARGDHEDEDWEGCFSIPNLVGCVRRTTAISVEHLLPSGEVTRSTFEGYVARVVQHEVDHFERHPVRRPADLYPLAQHAGSLSQTAYLSGDPCRVAPVETGMRTQVVMSGCGTGLRESCEFA